MGVKPGRSYGGPNSWFMFQQENQKHVLPEEGPFADLFSELRHNMNTKIIITRIILLKFSHTFIDSLNYDPVLNSVGIDLFALTSKS
jgi:hypothetical protein